MKIGNPYAILIGFFVGAIIGTSCGANSLEALFFACMFAIIFWLGCLGLEEEDFFGLGLSSTIPKIPPPPKEEEDPILDEIVTLFETIKEEGIVLSQAEDHKEITCSNLVLAYYVAKLERKL